MVRIFLINQTWTNGAQGMSVARYRMASFVIAGALSGLYGVLLAYFSRFADPNEFSFTAAVDGLVTAVVGGFTFFVAPVLGSVFLSIIPEIQRSLGIDAEAGFAPRSRVCFCFW